MLTRRPRFVNSPRDVEIRDVALQVAEVITRFMAIFVQRSVVEIMAGLPRVRPYAFLLIGLLCSLALLTACSEEQHKSKWKIMPLGDSITAGDGRRDVYRWPLWQLIQEAGVDIDFVGTIHSDGLNNEFDTDHEGHSGFRTTDILGGLPAWLAANKPDIVLLHIGTNDIFQCWSVADVAGRIVKIIDVIHGRNPRAVILLAKIIPLGDAKALSIDDDRYCGTGKTLDELTQDLNQRLDLISALRSRVIVVDLHSALDARADLRDGTHPNESGQRKMAERWFQALKPIFAR
jgi:acyl-CoA thioesterase-1